MKHKSCGTEIEEYKTHEDIFYHPFFVGYCPKCDIAITKEAAED
jgi:hypothetical protein